MVGLPDNAVKESWYRIAAATTNIGFRIPVKRTTVNLAPADIRKEGSAYDLPIAIGMLAASGQINSENVGDYIIMGELALDGELRSIKGGLSIALKALSAGFKGVILPEENANEIAMVEGVEILVAKNLNQVMSISKLEWITKNIPTPLN